jgi:hypothetical protein
MDENIIATYCLRDDLFHAMHHQEDPQCQMSDAEALTTAFTAALFFRGNLASAHWMLKKHAYIPRMLSKSRFSGGLQSRLLHRPIGGNLDYHITRDEHLSDSVENASLSLIKYVTFYLYNFHIH